MTIHDQAFKPTAILPVSENGYRSDHLLVADMVEPGSKVLDVGCGEGDLLPEWVIDARIAYAAALDAYAKEDAALRESDYVAKRNLEAVDAALSRVQMLQSIQNHWLKLAEEEK